MSILESRTKTSFPALSHKNFRYFWFGQCISLIGTWMQNIGQSWLVYKLTNSAFLLGLVGVLQFTPVMLLSLFAGVIVDKFNKRRILLFTQTSSMLLAFILSALVFTNTVNYWEVLILATLLGVVNTYDMPARQAFMIELVGKESLHNAIALNSTVFNAARIVGPAIAGVLMGKLGIWFCFFINGISYIAVIMGLLKIDIAYKKIVNKTVKPVFSEIKEGLKYSVDTPQLLRVLILVAVMGTFAVNFSVLIPVFAKSVLHQSESGFGFLMSSMGVGSLTGAVLLAINSRKQKKVLLLSLSPVLISFFMIIMGFTNNYIISCILLALMGIMTTSFFTVANSTIQTITKDEFRGRVMGLYSLLFAGTTPLGNFYAGSISGNFGSQAGFYISGLTVIFWVAVITIKYKDILGLKTPAL